MSFCRGGTKHGGSQGRGAARRGVLGHVSADERDLYLAVLLPAQGWATMAVLTYSGISEEITDALVANVTVNAPIEADPLKRAINSAYQMVWEISGGRLKKIASAG